MSSNTVVPASKALSPLSVNHYTSKTALDPYWSSRVWKPTLPEQYIHSHRYIGESVLHALQATSLVPASPDFLQAGYKAFPLPKGDIKVLDACCGPGIVQSLLFENKEEELQNFQVVGADLNEVMLGEARRKAEFGKWKGIELKQVNVAETGYPDGTFSHILCSFAIYFFPDNHAILTEFRRLLKPGGLVFFSSPIYVHAIPLVNNALKSIPDAPPFPPALPAFESNRIDSATGLLEKAGHEPKSVIELSYDAGMESAKMAAEATAPVIFEMGKKWPEEVRRDVLEGIRKDLEGKFGEGKVEYPQKMLIAVGRKPE